jgi:hypothetical protein
MGENGIMAILLRYSGQLGKYIRFHPKSVISGIPQIFCVIYVWIAFAAGYSTKTLENVVSQPMAYIRTEITRLSEP